MSIKKALADHLGRNSKWSIKRFKSERDWEDGVVYRPIEAREMFNAPQFTIIQGGLIGAANNLSVITAALGEKLSKKALLDLIGQFKHLFTGNVLLNEGINELWTIVASAASGTKFSAANAYLGVGDDDAAADPAQTGLNPVTPGNEVYVAMDGTYPQYGTSQKATWRSTFTSAVGNFNWREFTVANGNSGASVNLNRKVSSQGTKASGQSWELSLEITLA